MEGTRIAEILSDEHRGHYAWEVEPFDPEAVLGAYISMADVECGQPLGVALVVLADGDSDAEIEWARSVADDIAGRLNEHAELATLAAQAERYRTALETAREALNWRDNEIRLGIRDPLGEEEIRAVGERFGYGVLMSTASRLWYEKAGSGAFAVGHCIAIVEKADRVAAAALEGDEK